MSAFDEPLLAGGTSVDEVPPTRPLRWPDRRAERWLGAVVVAVVCLLVAMMVFVFIQGWPSFAHNGLGWFGSGGSVDGQIQKITQSASTGHGDVWTFHGWALIWSTILIAFTVQVLLVT